MKEEKKEKQTCPECGTELEELIGCDTETDTLYDGVICPNGCDLWAYYT